MREQHEGTCHSRPIFSILQAHMDFQVGIHKAKRVCTFFSGQDQILMYCDALQAQKSVTAISFLPHRENLLLSSGSGNGYVGRTPYSLPLKLIFTTKIRFVHVSRILRTWDVRYTTPTGRRRKAGTVGKAQGCADESRDLTALNVISGGSGSKGASEDTRVVAGRSRGVASVAVHPMGSVAWALGKNGRYVWDLWTGTFAYVY